MDNRDRRPGGRTILALVLALVCTGSAWAQSPADTNDEADSTVVQETFAQEHLHLDWDGLALPWLGRPYDNQRINWSLDSLDVLYNTLQQEWRPEFTGMGNSVFIYQLLAGDTTGIPIAFDYDTYRLIKSEQNTLADWQASVQSMLRLRDSEKARDLVSISLPFKLPKAMQSIVGEGGAGLKVNGFKRINFSGRSQWRDGPNISLQQSQSKFPSLDMEQITQMTITGKIGSKIEVKVDQDSRRVTDLGNRIQIRYRGFEDEILQTIEAGNTNLSLPNTQFVGYSQNVQGLFGIKATAQVGHLSLTAIASQEKGSTEGATFTAGAKGEESFVRDDQYLRYRYFWLFDPFTDPDSTWANYIRDSAEIITFKLYRTADFENQVTEPQALVLPTVPPGLTIDSARQQPSNTPFSEFQRLGNLQIVEETDYFVERRQFWLTLSDNHPVHGGTLAGCYMEIQTSTGVDTIGAIAPDASPDSISYILTMIKSDNRVDPTNPSWILEWKNVYDLGVRDINIDGLQVDVYKGRRGTERQVGQNENSQDGTPYMQILGIDRAATDGTLVPDGVIDDNPQILDRRRGHLIFLNSFPFAPTTYPTLNSQDPLNLLGDMKSYAPNGDTLKDETPRIYNGLTQVNRQEASAYYLAITTTERRTTYSLGRVNIIEGSEVVKLNGRQLQRGVDYNINTDIGQITFLTEEMLDPNANVTVDYEYEPFFSVDRKSLFGLRGEYRPSQNFHWGGTLLFKSEQQPDNQKPRLGEEPSRTLIYDTDMGLRTTVPILTQITNALPFVEATAPSNLDIQAELAQSLPNPNTFGVVYIDDFEASQEIVSQPLFREAWTISSSPAPPDPRTDSSRGSFFWFNRFDPYRLTEIYNKDEVPAEDRTQVLSMQLDSSRGPLDWGGMQRSMSSGLQNFTNTQYIEFRVQGNHGTLVFDMGQITEDVNDNDAWDTEDLERNGFRNGVLDTDPDEDVGLDGIPDLLECNDWDPVGDTCWDAGKYNASSNKDPHGDNWFYSDDADQRNEYSRVNGTERNRPDPIRGWLPDSEDLNGNKSLDRLNNYFEYEINLADPLSPFLVKNSEFCNDCSDGSTLGPWRTFRIPVNDSTATGLGTIIGTPSLLAIEFMRLYVTGVDLGRSARVNIADMSLVSYRWRDVRVVAAEDSGQALRIAVVNTRENANYTSPPGVDEVIDRVTLIGQGEQSLLLEFINLQPRVPDGDSTFDTTYIVDTTWVTNPTPPPDSIRQFDTTGIVVDTTVTDQVDQVIVSQTLLSSQDYTGYRKLQMYVHGDDSASGSYIFFLRFGTDTTTFYEYRSPVVTGWTEINDIDVDFNELTGLKFNAQQGREISEYRDIDTVDGRYRVKGNPSLSRIEYLEMGIANLDLQPRQGQVWVDELRLTDVRDDVGYAARASINVGFSDFAGVSVAYRTQNYAFKTLTQSRQNVVNSSSQEDISVSARISPHKILPPSIPLQIPVSVTWGRNTSTPYFVTRSDIVVPEDARDEEATRTERKGVSIGARYARQGGNVLERFLFTPLSGSGSYSASETRSPTIRLSRRTSYSWQARYQLNIAKPPSVPLLYFTRFLLMPRSIYSTRFTLLPSRFNASGNFARSEGLTQYIKDGDPTRSFTRTFQGNFALGYTPITNLSFDYTYNTSRDLRNNLRLVFPISKFKLGDETAFNQQYRTSYTNRWIWFLEQRYSYDVSYREHFERHQAIPTRSITSSRSFQASFGVSWLKLFGPQNPNDRFFTVAFYQPIRKIVRGVFNRLDNLSFSYGRSWQERAFGYNTRPAWQYMFGIPGSSLDPGEFSETVGVGNQTSEGRTDSYSARSGVHILGARFTFNYTKREQNNESSSSRTKTVSETAARIGGTVIPFPGIRMTYSDLSKIGFIRAITNSATLESAIDHKKDTQENLNTEEINRESNDRRFSPLLGLNVNWRGGLSTQFKYDVAQRFDRQPSSATQSATLTQDNGFTLNVRYSFSAPNGIKLPFLGGLRLRSTMNLSVGVTYSRSRTWQGINNPAVDILKLTDARSDRTTLSIPIQVGYSFSQTLSGGLRARWQDTDDKIQQARTHVRELGFWVEFRF